MTRYLLALGIGVSIGVVSVLSLLWKPQRVAASWREDEDGIQPVDPRTDPLELARLGAHVRAARWRSPSCGTCDAAAAAGLWGR